MTPWLVLPVKSIEHGKSRLAGVLDNAARRRLNLALLDRALAVAVACVGADRTLVVSACVQVQNRARGVGTQVLREAGRGLNDAVAQAVDHLAAVAAPLVVMAGDLPLARADDLRALPRHGEVVLATDREGTGTNVLALPPGIGFRFQYGAQSRHRHAAEAARLGLNFSVRHPASLAFDLDTADDYVDWLGCRPPMAASGLPALRSACVLRTLAEPPTRPGEVPSPSSPWPGVR